MTERAAARRTGPAQPAAPDIPRVWPRRLLVAIVSPDAGLRRELRAALSHPRSPACVVFDVPTLAACDRPEGRIARYFLVDSRTADACDTGGWTPSRKHALLSRRLWIQLGEAPPTESRPGAPAPRAAPPIEPSADAADAADAALAWDEGLWGVPFRTYPGDPTFAARLRARLTLLPADAWSEWLFEAVTTSPDGREPRHVGPTLGCPTCRPEPPATSLRRGTWEADALLRLVRRPEWYLHAVGHAVLEPNVGREAAEARERRRASLRRVFYRACANAGLLPPHDVALAALVVRASALAPAFGLGIERTARLLGFTPAAGTGRPSRSTWHRILVRVTGVAPAQLARLSWADIGEAARRALVWPTRGRHDPPHTPPHVLRPRQDAPAMPPAADAWHEVWDDAWVAEGGDRLYDARYGELAEASPAVQPDPGLEGWQERWRDPLDRLRPVVLPESPTRGGRSSPRREREPRECWVGDGLYAMARAAAFRAACRAADHAADGARTGDGAADAGPAVQPRAAATRAQPGSAYAAVLRSEPCRWCGAPGEPTKDARRRRTPSRREAGAPPRADPT